jgi:hypothetical protein
MEHQEPGEEQMGNWNIDWNNKVAEVLENCARDWRDGTIGWTQKAMARDGSGDRTSIMYPEGGMLNPTVTEVCSVGGKPRRWKISSMPLSVRWTTS